MHKCTLAAARFPRIQLAMNIARRRGEVAARARGERMPRRGIERPLLPPPAPAARRRGGSATFSDSGLSGPLSLGRGIQFFRRPRSRFALSPGRRRGGISAGVSPSGGKEGGCCCYETVWLLKGWGGEFEKLGGY